MVSGWVPNVSQLLHHYLVWLVCFSTSSSQTRKLSSMSTAGLPWIMFLTPGKTETEIGTLCHIPGWRRALSLTEQLPLSWYCRLFWNAACYWAELRLHYRPSCSIFGLRRTRNWVHPSFPKRVVSAFYVVRFLFKKKWKLCQQHTNAQTYLLDYISPLFYSILFEPWRTGLRKHKC